MVHSAIKGNISKGTVCASLLRMMFLSFSATEVVTIAVFVVKAFISLNIYIKVIATMLNATMENGHNGQQHVVGEKEEEICKQLEKQPKE